MTVYEGQIALIASPALQENSVKILVLLCLPVSVKVVGTVLVPLLLPALLIPCTGENVSLVSTALMDPPPQGLVLQVTTALIVVLGKHRDHAAQVITVLEERPSLILLIQRVAMYVLVGISALCALLHHSHVQ